MSLSRSDIIFAKELFSGIDGLSTRKMMGGLSIYCCGQIFSIVNSDGVIFLKAKNQLQIALELAGARQFSSTTKDGKLRKMGYWTLPEDALDDPDRACDWAYKALNDLS